MLTTFEDIRPLLRRRHLTPLNLLRDEGFIARLDGLGLPPWEVIPSRELAICAGISPSSLADWRYMFGSHDFKLEPERSDLFRGKTNYYRIDVIKAWHAAGGWRAADRSRLWVMAADFLESQKLKRPSDARQTDDELNMYWKHDIFPLRTEPKRLPYRPYSGPGNTSLD